MATKVLHTFIFYKAFEKSPYKLSVEKLTSLKNIFTNETIISIVLVNHKHRVFHWNTKEDFSLKQETKIKIFHKISLFYEKN